MSVFKPELCVLRKTKPEHYDLKQVRAFAAQYQLNASNLRLGKKELCKNLKEKYQANQAVPSKEVNKNHNKPAKGKKGKNRNIVLANKSPLKADIRKNPKQLRNNIKSRIKERALLNKSRTSQRMSIKRNLNKYYKNRNYKYKEIPKQIPIDKKNPLQINKYSNSIILAVQLQFGEISLNNLSIYQKQNIDKVNDQQFIRAIIEYQNFKSNPYVQIQSIEVPRTWKPSTGKMKLNISNTEKELTCSIKPKIPLYLETIAYIDSEVINDTIHHVYDIKNLVKHMKIKGYCPGQPWKQLTPDNIKLFSKSLISNSDLDVQGLLYVRELQKIHKSNILTVVETMLSQVHRIENKNKLVIHAQTTNNIKQRRGNCGSAIIELYDYIQEHKSFFDKKNILKELGESLPVCIEAKCNFIREFVEMKRGGLKFTYNSGITKDGNISNAVLFFINKWCGESAKKLNPREYFLGKLPDLFTRVQALLQNKNASNGKIDYLDILHFILENGEYMLNCGNLNFNNINLNTENQKRELFGMRGIR